MEGKTMMMFPIYLHLPLVTGSAGPAAQVVISCLPSLEDQVPSRSQVILPHSR